MSIPTRELQARETNLPDTGFVVRPSEPGADYRLRWFTPTVEVDLCGHATLATGHCLRGRRSRSDSLCHAERRPQRERRETSRTHLGQRTSDRTPRARACQIQP